MKNKIGVMYLTKSDQIDAPLTVAALLALPCWTNPHVKGVVLRTSWGRIQPSKTGYYFDFLDAGVDKAIQTGKKVSLCVPAGVGTPGWFTSEFPGDCFSVTEVKGAQVPMGLPWKSNFKAYWGATIGKMADRYDARICHIDMGGPGRKSESFFATEGDDFERLTALVKTQGYPDARTAWVEGAKWVTGVYADYFAKAGFICDLGAPFVGAPGAVALQTLVDYGTKMYPGRFGAASHQLGPTNPPDNSIGMHLSPTIRRGFQFGGPQDGDVAGMKAALDRGIAAGADWIEVYGGDCDDKSQWANLDAANAAMTKQATT